ncbi:BIG2 domain-containing protein [Pseudomonas sp. IT-P74]|uniref:Ig-like domain-containing protein n=1 Tax=Pseudomonas sp. IT-P74 TaxID=3026445 RepID=UPI0039DF8780
MSHFRSFLFPVFPAAISPLALRPLLIAGMTHPVVDGDGGLNIHAVEEYPEGILCAVNAYSFPMLAGDTLDIYWGTKKLLTRIVEPDEVDKTVFFFLDAEAIVSGWVEEVYYVLTRQGEPVPDDPAVPLRLLVKLDRPAGRDKDPHLPGHSELHIAQLPEDVIKNGVDAEWAQRGVPMTIGVYPNIAVRDVVQVKWGSAYLAPHFVTTAQVDGSEPIVITATQADILAGGDSAALMVQYEVHDEVWNYSEQWSQATTVRVEAGAWRLDPPMIRESDNGVIDLKKLNQKDVTVQVLVVGTDFDLGDTVTMTWIGTPLTGNPLIHTESWTVDNIPSVKDFMVPYAEVRAIAMGSADASYVLTKLNGGPPLSSKRAFASVIGDVYAHPAPTIRELVGNLLEPDNSIATVDITYPGMTNGDFINLRWLGTRSNGQPYVHGEEYTVSQGDAERKKITIYVLSEHIAVLADGKLDLSYVVSNDKAAIYGVSESEHLLVDVKAIRATLPAPKVVEADDDVLDPSKIFDNATVRIEYLGTLKGDILTYYWTGISAGSSTSDWLPITSVIAGKPVNFRVDAWFVSANIGQYVKVRYTLKHAGTGLTSYSATLNLLIGQLVGELPPPRVIQAPDDELDPMNATQGVDVSVEYANMDPALDTIALKWRGTPGAGTSEDLELPADASGRVKFSLPSSVVGPNIGKSVAVSYEVKRYNFWKPSDLLTLNVLRFQDPDNQLPRPQVPQAPNGILDLMTFAGDARVTVDKWPFIALKQRIWLRLQGKTASGATHTIELLDGTEITQTQLANGLNETLLRSELLKLGHASPATVICKVAFDGDSQEHTAIEFPRLALTVKTRYDYLTPEITDVADPKGTVGEGESTYFRQVTITGTATRGEKVELFDGSMSLGPVDVDNGGIWTKVLTNLIVKNYHILARALYDAAPVDSLLRTFSVVEAITPTIANVTDAKGTVPERGTTYFRSVTVTGTASPNHKVELFDGATSLGEIPTGNGTWTRVINSLTIKAYSLTAKALYGGGAVSEPPRTFTVARADKPVIDNVTDANGTVPEGGTTYFRSVTVTGTASPNQTVELFDGTTSLFEVPTGNGTWNRVISSLAFKPYTLTARALYGEEPVSEPPRTFTVARADKPVIKNVTDAKGTVPEGGTTYYRSVTVTGTASPNQTVELFDGTTSLFEVPTGNGTWNQVINSLAFKPYTLTARALYGEEPVSEPPRTFTVAQADKPVIKNVTDAKGTVPEGGTTYYRSVTVTGTASPNQTVELFDGTTSLFEVPTENGTWNQVINSLAVKPYRLTAKALYGDGAVSEPPRTFTVAVASAPEITNVTDSKGSVPNGGTTYDRSVTVTGTASANRKIQLRDGATVLGEATGPSWSLPVGGLSARSYRLVAVDEDGSESPAYTFTVAVASAPRITNVSDSKGPVPNGGTTYDRSVTVIGTATANREVELRDGNTPLGNDTGPNWRLPISGLSARLYRLVAVDEDGLESPAYTFNVAEAGTPDITNVTDSKGPVPNGGTTYDRSVTVTVTASANRKIRLYDSNTLLDEGSGPIWNLSISGLSEKTYNLVAVDEGDLTSPTRTFTVATHVAPTITSVRDSRGELPDGGSTTDTTVSLQGSVTPNHEVQIHDNNEPKHIVRAVGDTWNATLPVALGGHSITVKAVSTGQFSNARRFTVNTATPPLNFNISPVTLDGKIYLLPNNPEVLPAFGPGTSVQHQASGGVPGYTYSSSNTAVAVVDTTGLVTVRGRGTANITVQDAVNQSLSYTVTVTGVIHCVGLGRDTWARINTAATQAGARIPSYAELYELHQAYGSRWPMGNALYWSTTQGTTTWPFPSRKCMNIVTSANGDVHEQGGSTALGVGFR